MTEVQDTARHPRLLVEITCDCQNSIRIIDSPHPIQRYTCLMHVMDFVEKPEYIDIAIYRHKHVYAGAAFAHWLIERRVMSEVSQTEAQDGDLVFYFNEDRFKHVGIWRPRDHVFSKWGVGHLYDHKIFEIPISYGSDVKLYKKLLFDDAFRFFTQFAVENGISIQRAGT